MFADASIRWTDPTTWPWMFYVWAALVLVGWAKPAWNWFRSKRAAGWPLAEGRIESVETTKPRFSFTTRRGYYVAELGYSYSVAGTHYSGRYKRELPTEYEAEEFVRDLQGKPVAVHCNPATPSSSALLNPDINTLLQNRAPAPPSDSSVQTNSVTDWIRPYLWLFVSLSAIGLVVSLWVHLGAVTGRRVAPEAFFWVLHIGIFVVWFPAVFVAQRLVGNLNRRDLWKVVLKDSPDWMRYMVYGFFAYAFVNFMFFMTKAPSGSNGANPPAEVWRGSPGIGWRSTQPRSLFSILLLVPRIQACGVPTGIQHRPLLPTVRGAVNCPQSSVTAEAEDGDSASLESHPNWIGIATFRPPFNQQMSRGPRTNSRMHALSARYS